MTGYLLRPATRLLHMPPGRPVVIDGYVHERATTLPGCRFVTSH
jgi:hypothetical protein